MKLSDRVLIACGIVIFVALISVLIFIRSAIHTRPIKEPVTFGPGDTTIVYQLDSFRHIRTSGPWWIEASRSEQCGVVVSADKKTLPDCKITVSNDTLILIDNSPEGASTKTLSVRIGCPSLRNVSLSGSSMVELKDYEEDEFALICKGTTRVLGTGMTVKDIRITSSGALNLDFNRVLTTSAHLNLAGIIRGTLTMAGGEITGSIIGTGNMICFGESSAIKVSQIGLVYVH